MTKIWIAAGVVAALAAGVGASVVTRVTDTGAAPQADLGAGTPVPVLVELFTSEGCSSSPPADHVLSTLAAEGTMGGARVIGLGEHVDYWDRLGWRDRFSWAGFTARQQEYARALRSDVYTPQMVVDGRKVFVGSDMTRAKAAIAAAARDTSDRVRVSIARVPGERPWPRGRVRERLFSDPRSPSATAPMGGRWRPWVTDLIQTMAQRAGQSALVVGTRSAGTH